MSEKAGEVAGKIDDAHGRYDATGRALTAYADALDGAQARSERALRDAQNADQALTAAQGRVRRASGDLDDADDETDDAELARLRRSLASARGDRDAAEAALARARTELDGAITDRDTAAARAEQAIRAGMSGDGLGDSWWDDWGSAVVHAISSVAGIVAGVAGILALVLCWVPVLGQALAVVAAVATAVKLVADIALLAAGEGSWSDVAWGAVSLATFGVGRVISVAARGASTGAQGVARLESGRLAATSMANRVSMGLRSGSSQSAINQMVGPRLGDLSRVQARSLAGQASDSVTQMLLNKQTLSTLRPSALWSDVRAMSGFTWSGAMDAARANFAAAGNNPTALLAATQADGDMVRAAAGLTDISGTLAAHSSATAQAARTATVGNGMMAGSVGLGGYDQTVGMSATTDWIQGESAPPAIAAPFVEIFSAWGPSPAQRLNLP
ncbi:hypothetical protein [Cellulomonas hominis]